MVDNMFMKEFIPGSSSILLDYKDEQINPNNHSWETLFLEAVVEYNDD